MVKKVLSCLLFISFILSSGLATGQTIIVNFPITSTPFSVNSTQDACLNGAAQTTNSNVNTMIVQRQDGNRQQRAVVAFDISSIPPGAYRRGMPRLYGAGKNNNKNENNSRT